MEARELRVGNYVNDKYGNICTVEWLSKQSLTVNKINFPKKYFIEYSLNKIQPIPLTEEILLKCNIERWINETFEIRKNLDDTFTIYAWSNGISIFICHLKYLHSFQNIYPFLTNEELTINL